MWLYIIELDGLWQHPVYLKSIDWSAKYTSKSQVFQYNVSVYFALLLLLGYDVQPLSNLQSSFAFIAILLGIFIKAVILGKVLEMLIDVAHLELFADSVAKRAVFAMRCLLLPT